MNQLRISLQQNVSDISYKIINKKLSHSNFNQMKNLAGEIPVFQEQQDEHVWKKMEANVDSIYIFDRCGRLSHKLEFPWSIVNYPYLKDAILSAHTNSTCGACSQPSLTNAIEQNTISSVLSHNDRKKREMNDDFLELNDNLTWNKDETKNQKTENIGSMNDGTGDAELKQKFNFVKVEVLQSYFLFKTKNEEKSESGTNDYNTGQLKINFLNILSNHNQENHKSLIGKSNEKKHHFNLIHKNNTNNLDYDSQDKTSKEFRNILKNTKMSNNNVGRNFYSNNRQNDIKDVDYIRYEMKENNLKAPAKLFSARKYEDEILDEYRNYEIKVRNKIRKKNLNPS